MTFFENDRPVPKANKDLACGSAERMKPHERDYIELTYISSVGRWCETGRKDN